MLIQKINKIGKCAFDLVYIFTTTWVEAHAAGLLAKCQFIHFVSLVSRYAWFWLQKLLTGQNSAQRVRPPWRVSMK